MKRILHIFWQICVSCHFNLTSIFTGLGQSGKGDKNLVNKNTQATKISLHFRNYASSLETQKYFNTTNANKCYQTRFISYINLIKPNLIAFFQFVLTL